MLRHASRRRGGVLFDGGGDGEGGYQAHNGKNDKTAGFSAVSAQLKQIDGGAIVDPVIGGFAGISQPAPAAGGLQAQVMADHTFPRGTGGDALGQGGYADADFHRLTSIPCPARTSARRASDPCERI